MGNSASQNKITENTIPKEQWTQSVPKSYQSQVKLNCQYKVLPENTPKLKLRTTNNGEILQSGGTISGRHIGSTKERTKGYLETFEEQICTDQREYENKVCHKMAEQSKLSNNYDKYGSNNVSSQQMKVFVSEPDLRCVLASNASLEKRPKKKYKAPSPPIMNGYKITARTKNKINIINPTLPTRKERLFKTRVETKKQSSHLNEDDLPNLNSIRNIYNSKHLSLPEVSTPFTAELEAVTKHFSYIEKEPQIDKGDYSFEPKTLIRKKIAIPENLKKKFIESLEDNSKKILIQSSEKKSYTPEMSPTLKPIYQINKDVDSRPKQLFYFGMHETSRNSTAKEDIYKNSNINMYMQKSSESDVSSYIDSDESETIRTGINLKLRPILPKKQLEIPRFSPLAAWRLLSLDANENNASTTPRPILTKSYGASVDAGETDIGLGGTVITDDLPLLMDEQIEKYSRPLPYLFNSGRRSCNDKSGDSGISGDDGVPIVYYYDDDIINDDNEDSVSKMRITNRAKKEQQTTSWTPQQDLDDSSGDDLHRSVKQKVRTCARPHVFSLSLPRENHLATYMTEEVTSVQHNGIQKFKKSLSGVWGNLSNKKVFLHNNYFNEKNNNWFLSKSAPNSLTNAIHSLERYKTHEGSHVQSYSHINRASRLMYLPELDLSPNHTTKNIFGRYINDSCHLTSKSCENIMLELKEKSPELQPQPLQDPKPNSDDLSFNKKRKPKKYTFKSTIRQIEKKRLSVKLSKEAEKREKERIRELDAMQKVEEEFQKKRASEKANLQQQLRLFSLDGYAGSQSLQTFEIKNKDRPEADDTLFSSSSSSSSFSENDFLKKITYLEDSTYHSRLKASSTKELSEFREIRRNYKDYNSNLLKHTIEKRNNRPTTIHPQVSCSMPQVPVSGLSCKESHNYRK